MIKRLVIQQTQDSQYLIKSFKREFEIHSKLKHPNIVNLIQMHQTVNNIYIIQQYCSGTTLKQFLRVKKRLTQQQTIFCMKQICKGYSQLVNKGIIHRDIKPQNILLQGNTLKLCDFGFAKQINTHNQILTSTVGSPLYMSPQILKQQKYNSKCDVWSFGIIVYQMLFGRLPWQAQNTIGLIRKILQQPLQFPSQPKISQQMQQFIRDCLLSDQRYRLSWLQIFQHGIFKQQQQFTYIAKKYRNNVQQAKNKLNNLASIVKPYQLVGIFLQCKVKSLDYQLFNTIIKQYLIPQTNQQQISIMYQMFDKDCNGVIELGQFIKAFQVCHQDIADILNYMVQLNLTYQDMRNQQMFKNYALGIKNDKNGNKRYPDQKIYQAYAIIMQIEFQKKN